MEPRAEGINHSSYLNILLILAMPAVVMVSVSSHIMFIASVGTMGWLLSALFNGASRWGIPLVIMVYGALLLDEKHDFDKNNFFKRDVTILTGTLVLWFLAYELITAGTFRNVLAGTPYSPLGFLVYLIGLHTLVPMLRRFVCQVDRPKMLISVILLFSASVLLPRQLPIVTYISFFINLTGFLLLGQFLHKFSFPKVINGLLIAAGLAGALITAGSTALFSFGWGQPLMMPWNPNMILFTAALFLLAKTTIFGKIARSHVPKNTVSLLLLIYMVHDLILWFLARPILPRIEHLERHSYTFIPVMFVIVFGVSAGVVFLWQLLLRKPLLHMVLLIAQKYEAFCSWQMDSFDEKPLRQYAHCVIVLFTLFFILFIFGPVYIAANAIGGVHALDIAVLLLFFAGSVVAALFLAWVVHMLRHPYRYAESLLTGLLLSIFVNGLLFPFSHELIDDGSLGRLSLLSLFRNLLMIVISIAIVSKFRKNLRLVAIPLLVVAMGYTIFVYSGIEYVDDAARRTAEEEIFDSAATFSTHRNILVIVMESLQGTVAERVFLDYPYLLDGFDGFTLFTRAFSSFPNTSFSINAIRSGQLYFSDSTAFRDHAIASNSDNFLTDMRDHGVRGYAVGVPIPGGGFPVPRVGQLLEPNPIHQFGYAFAASIARTTGYWPPNPLTEGGRGERHAGTSWKLESVLMHQQLIERFNVQDIGDNLLYLWDITLYHPHGLFTKTGEILNPMGGWGEAPSLINETYFGLSQLTRLFETMKANDVYDNTLIIIVGDHGIRNSHLAGQRHLADFEDFQNGYRANGNIVPVHHYNTALFIKPPSSYGQAVITHNPAWNGDVRALVNHYFKHFYNTDPIDVVAGIRAENPEVSVIFARPQHTRREIMNSSEHHEIVYVTSLHEIAAAFAAHSGISE